VTGFPAKTDNPLVLLNRVGLPLPLTVTRRDPESLILSLAFLLEFNIVQEGGSKVGIVEDSRLD